MIYDEHSKELVDILSGHDVLIVLLDDEMKQVNVMHNRQRAIDYRRELLEHYELYHGYCKVRVLHKFGGKMKMYSLADLNRPGPEWKGLLRTRWQRFLDVGRSLS